jgi:nitrate reductase gamma subunit
MNFLLSMLVSLFAVSLLVLIPWVGVWALDLRFLFGVIVPYAALATFFAGIVVRVVNWGRSPVPFRIPTTAGQGSGLPWIKTNPIDNPSTRTGVIARMALEILLFRSLFRNSRLEFRGGPKIAYEWEKWLWLGALAFHYAFLVIVLRHLRFFMEPIPSMVLLLERLDGLLEMGILPLQGAGIPGVLISDLVLLLAVTYLFLRRIYIPQVRYISLPADYFPLFLIIAIALTGVLIRYTGPIMRYAVGIDVLSVDIIRVKELAIGLFKFRPKTPEGIGTIFYIHLFLVSVLIAYFPFSKLMHLAGIFLSPTRNLANNSRAVRHVNPWDYPVKVHSYEAYEEEFRDKMVEAGLPLDKAAAAESDEANPEQEG